MIKSKQELSIVRQCKLLDVHRSGVYHRPRPSSPINLALMREIDEIHLNRPFLGVRRVTDELCEKARDGSQQNPAADAPWQLACLGTNALPATPHPVHPAMATIDPNLWLSVSRLALSSARSQLPCQCFCRSPLRPSAAVLLVSCARATSFVPPTISFPNEKETTVAVVNPHHTLCRHAPEWWPDMVRNQWPAWPGIRTRTICVSLNRDLRIFCSPSQHQLCRRTPKSPGAILRGLTRPILFARQPNRRTQIL